MVLQDNTTLSGIRSHPPPSSITNLSIRGVRSFDNQDKMSIAFQTPLTLIVGVNGSGKTTIIECLKYATTGALPPNSKGGAFVHDPKLTDEKEVMAQVKLGFLNGSQGELVVNRSMSLTVKKASNTFKTLECNLLMKSRKSGERTSMSSTVAQLNQLVPQQLGVSPAILESVIFCHQDESLWPMEEPSKLKTKFDEIFEAQKYTKAIENIIKLRKGHVENLSKLKIHEANFKALKDKSEKVKQKMVDLRDEIDVLGEKSDSLKKEIQAAEKVAAEKQQLKAEAHGIIGRLDAKRAHAATLKYNIDSLRETLVELQDSDELLQSNLDQYEQRMVEYRKSAAENREQYDKLGKEAKVCRDKISGKEIEQGQHEAAKKNYEGQLVQRAKLVQEAALAHSLRGYDGELDEDQVRDFVQRLQKLGRDKQRELESVHNATQDELKQTQSALSQLENRQATLKQERVNAVQATSANDRKIRSRQVDLDSIHMDEGAKAGLDASVNDLENRLQKANSEWNTAAWDRHLKAETSRRDELEAESEKLSDELIQNTKLAEERAALGFAKKQANAGRLALNTMISTHQNRLTEVIGQGWTTHNLQVEYQSVLESKSRTLGELKSQQDSAVTMLKQTEYELKTARSTLTKKTSELQSNKVKLFDSIYDVTGEKMFITSLDQYLEEYRDLESAVIDCKNNLAGADALLDMYKKFGTMVDKNCCLACERSFVDLKQRTVAASKVEKWLKSVEEKKLKEELKTSEGFFKTADAVRPLYDVCKKLQDIEIPSLENDIKRLEGQKSSRVADCERQDRLVGDEESAKRDIESLAKTVADIAKYVGEISKHDDDITRLSSQETMSGSSLSIDEIKEKSTACNDKLRTIKLKIEKLRNDKESARLEISNLEKQVGTVSAKLADAKRELEKKHTLLSAIEELRDNNNQYRNVMKKVDTELESLEPQFAKARSQHEDVQTRGNAKAKEVQIVKDKLAETVNSFKSVEGNITYYIENDGPGQLAACQRDIKLLKKNQERIEKETKEVGKTISQLDAKIAESDNGKKGIQENIRYRKSLRELEVYNRDIAELETHNADDDYEQYRREADAAEKKSQKLIAERGPIIGSIRAKDEDLEKTITEWKTDYKDAASDYRKAHVEVTTTKAAIEDMQKCSKALDNAIMQFHSVKMEEINTIAGELWRATYQGTDVDTIMIRSENDNATTSTRRSFNYRLVMVKQDAEMDMRGRCSAGQRVLACIIIRLALAECFGVNCGVIALDEPTTNLDQDNIKALAQSLHMIIQSRQHQPNFQLIIITHDEEFLKEMKCTDFTETYYRVSRNAQQKSEIHRQSLAELMD